MSRTDEQTADLIRAAYREITPAPGAWVRLVDLREQLGDVNRHQVDRVLDNMFPEVDLMPESNQKSLTQTARDLAVRSGGMDNHLMRIG